MRPTLAAFSCILAFALCGCSHPDQSGPPTANSVQTQMEKVQNDPKIPPEAKGALLANLQRLKDLAQKQASAKH